jgi:DNA-binding transcriptional ArsR family regulator
MNMKRALGVDPTRQAVADSLQLKSKSVISQHLSKLEKGNLICLGRKGEVSLTTEGLVILRFFESGGAIA